eukprot:symbB.v1.2.039544.t1/scaffold6637.1/size16560/1
MEWINYAHALISSRQGCANRTRCLCDVLMANPARMHMVWMTYACLLGPLISQMVLRSA